jgi:hypothetical protein
MPPPADHTLLFDPHFGPTAAHFVTTRNHLALYLATIRLATLHTQRMGAEHSSANLIILTATQPLAPDTVHNLIHIVATSCGIIQPLHLPTRVLWARPNGTPSPS